MKRFAPLFIVLCTLAATAAAEPYWYAYEGNDFPENEGWWHIWGDEPANRSIEDGCLVLDAAGDSSIVDYYVRKMYSALNPEPGETFALSWRLLVESVDAVADPTMAVFGDEGWAVSFTFGEGHLRSLFESDKTASFEPAVFHEYELLSADMRTYDLYLDGQLTLSGAFWDSLTKSELSWGDGIEGAASLSRWDYVRFGVIPEPASCLLFATSVLLGRAAR